MAPLSTWPALFLAQFEQKGLQFQDKFTMNDFSRFDTIKTWHI